MSNLTVTLEHDPAAELTQPICQGLIAFDQAHAGAQNPRNYALVVRDDEGNVLGGLIAEEHWGWLYVAWLWLPDSRAVVAWAANCCRRRRRSEPPTVVDTRICQRSRFRRYRSINDTVTPPGGLSTISLSDQGSVATICVRN
jgi:hypothetical protein